MIRKSHLLLALALVAAAVAAPIAQPNPKPVDPLAVGYLMGQGLTPSEVTSWTAGACSHQVKDAACYAMLKPAETSFTPVSYSTGFQWGDAGIGAGFTLGIVLLLAGVGAGLLISRRNGRHETARVA